jgi:hypothetical protein
MKPEQTLTLVIFNIITPVSREQIAGFPSIDNRWHSFAIRSVITHFDGLRFES